MRASMELRKIAAGLTGGGVKTAINDERILTMATEMLANLQVRNIDNMASELVSAAPDFSEKLEDESVSMSDKHALVQSARNLSSSVGEYRTAFVEVLDASEEFLGKLSNC